MRLERSDGSTSPDRLPVHVGPPDQTAIIAYSEHGQGAYEDPENLSSLYGMTSKAFLETLRFRDQDRFIADIGCGTGFAFDVLGATLQERGMVGIGIDPAPGMLMVARTKYPRPSRFRFLQGEGEAIPLPDRSIDRVVSTLALHWVKDLNAAAAELRRILKDDGMIDVLMIANEDGFVFKRAVLAALRRHLTFSQIMKAAGLAQRERPADLSAILERHFAGFAVTVELQQVKVAGSVEEHLKWWRARSMPIVSDVADVDAFGETLRSELVAISERGMIILDGAFLLARVRPADGTAVGVD